MNNNQVLTLCVIMQFKHFIADYPLQNGYMLGKFKDRGWVLPLLAHCSVHSLFTLVIAWLYSQSLNIALLCALLDGFVHFVMDRIKASPNLLGRFEVLSKGEYRYLLEQKSHIQRLGLGNVNSIDQKFKNNTLFWYSLGLDQLCHHLTDIAVIAIIVWSV